MSKKVHKKYEQVYKQSYSSEFPCVSKSKKGDTFALCTVCRCDVSVSHGGKGDLITHFKTKKHKDNVRCEEQNQRIGRSFFTTEDKSVIRAECLFTSFIVEHNLPVACADHAGPLFRKMFPKSEIAKKYGCARTKTTAIIGEVAAVEEMAIVTALKQQPFSIATDGSNDCDSKLYPIVVTTFNSKTTEIESCLLAVPALEGDSTGRNIGKLLVNNLESRGIPMSNCLAFGADNAPVMIGEKNGVAAVLKEAHENLEVIGCPCHLINLAAEKSAACLPVKVDEILVDIYFYLEKSAKRKDKLKVFQKLHDTDVRKILKHVCTRWLSLGKCLQRMVDEWQPLVTFFHQEINNKNSSLSSCLESYTIPKQCKPTPVPNVKEPNTETDRNKPFPIFKSKDATVKPRPRPTDVAPVKNLKLDSLSSPTTSKKYSAHLEGGESSTAKRKAETCDTAMQSSKKSLTNKEPHYVVSREERLFLFLTSSLNKAFCLFLLNAVPCYEKTNILLQSKVPQIHVLRSLLLEMLMGILSRFVKPKVIKESTSILEIDYHSKLNQKEDADLLIGCATQNVVKDLNISDKVKFFASVRKYYVAGCDYMVHKLPFKSDILMNAEVAQIASFVNASFVSVRFFVDMFPILLLVNDQEDREAAFDSLQSQFCELQIEDLPETILNEERIDRQWSLIGALKSVDGRTKYDRLANVMLGILTIPHSNAECERVFSQVKKTRTQFRASMSNSNLEKLLIAKSRQHGQCFEQVFDDNFLKLAKSATKTSLTKSVSNQD